MRIPGLLEHHSDFWLTREQIMGLGLVFALVGLLEMVGAYFIAHSVTTHEAEASARVISNADECKNRLAGLGFTATIKGNLISAEMSGLDEAAYKLGQASIASLSCQGWQQSRFCMGEGCGEKGGVQIELQPIKLN